MGIDPDGPPDPDKRLYWELLQQTREVREEAQVELKTEGYREGRAELRAELGLEPEADPEPGAEGAAIYRFYGGRVYRRRRA